MTIQVHSTSPVLSRTKGLSVPGKSFLRLIGVTGYFSQVNVCLARGKSLVVGRSRRCSVSLQETPAYTNGDAAKIRKEAEFRKVSREHFKISFLHPYIVEIENLSQNGTYLDGKKVDRILLSDFRTKPHDISFGDGQEMRLEWESSGG